MTLNTVEDRVDIKRHSCPAQLEKIDYGTSSLVKELQIRVGAWSVYSGAAYRLLSDEPRESLLFPLVRKLSVTFFTSCESNDDVTPEIEVNISAFICRVKEMAPGVNHVAFAAIKEGTLYSHIHLNPLVRLDYLETLFASQLFGLVETTYLNRMTRFLVDCPGLAPIGNLVQIEFTIKDEGQVILPLIRRSAQTLQCLDFTFSEATDIAGLIRDPDCGGSEYTVYPRLRKLMMHRYEPSTVVQRPVIKDAVPFP
ncbi:hypothetical protein H4R27_006290, partial [Coemansia aciculifera]